MRIKTTYTPSFTLGDVHVISDLRKLADDLTAAGVKPDDALHFQVNADGQLLVFAERTL